MILVDTGVWSHHFRSREPALEELLRDDLVVTHSWVVGELARVTAERELARLDRTAPVSPSAA